MALLLNISFYMFFIINEVVCLDIFVHFNHKKKAIMPFSEFLEMSKAANL